MGFGNEDRQSFRATVVDQSEGTLLFGDTQISVRMLDQSATGFKLSTDDPRLIPTMVDALLDMHDGVEHTVQIRHVKQDGERQTLGIKRYETRLSGDSKSSTGDKSRRISGATALVALAILIVCGLALQAAPVRNQLAALPLFPPKSHRVSATTSDAVPEKNPTTPAFDRERPFEFRRYLEVDAADWLHLASAQRQLMRGLIEVCGGAKINRMVPAQRAFVDFAAQSSMLQLLHAEQRTRLEAELERPLSGSALLQTILERYAQNASPSELTEQFGALVLVSPAIAAKFGVSPEIVAAVCKQVDDAFPSPSKEEQAARGAADANQTVLEASMRIEQLKASCRTLLVPAAAKPAPLVP
ncbi:MAG: hypothetical protein C0483_12100 [Pirellula sp.]|nr:hypothetical protein [Pirellula sp.]